MRPSRAGVFRRALLTGALALALAVPHAGFAEEPATSPVLSWETGEGKSYLIPALEVPAFVLGLHLFDRFLSDTNDYDSDLHSIRKNLTSATVIDHDPFSTSQIGHPDQGSIYYGFARSACLNYWQSLAYTAAGSYLWETFAEKTPPSINDYVTTTIGGSFVGEALFRMSSLLLEGGGEAPGFWRELGAALLSPPTAFNRLVFGDRFKAVFPSRNPEIFIRLRLGVTLSTESANAGLSPRVHQQEGSLDYHMIYGLPGKPGYQYKRPFDFFLFEFTAVPNASSALNAIENFTVRGLLAGAKYELGDDFRGVWGLFGGYEYLSPRIFRVATTNVALGTVGQWWLTPTIALQGTALLGVGFGASGTVGDTAERDYRYGAIPEPLLGLRLILRDRAMLHAQGRQYWIVGLGAGASTNGEKFGHEMINRATVGPTVRVYGPHALSLHYVASTREGRATGSRDRHQSVETVTLSYNFLGPTRFAAVEWRTDATGGR